MSLNNDNILSIGSVVKLKKTDALAMIVGFTQVSYDDKNNYSNYSDYLGVKYPAGLEKNRDYLKFNSEDITDVVFNGYSNEIDVKMKKIIVDMVENNKVSNN